MESFYVVDIFATKGVEYILVVSFLVAFVAYWRYLNHPAAAAVRLPAHAAQPADAAWFKLAEGLHYHPSHSWVAVDAAAGVVRVGLDDFAHKLLGDLDQIELPEVGSTVVQGAPGWRVGIGNALLGLVSPVSGKVVEVNEAARRAPRIAADDPYERGWLAKIEVPALKTNLKNLLSGDLARAWLGETEARLRASMAGELGVLLQDGGLPVSGIAKSISPERWEDVVRSYLMAD